MKPNWNKLKDYKCPKCNGALNYRPETMTHKCPTADCFIITDSKFKEVVNSLHKPKYQEPDRSNWE